MTRDNVMCAKVCHVLMLGKVKVERKTLNANVLHGLYIFWQDDKEHEQHFEGDTECTSVGDQHKGGNNRGEEEKREFLSEETSVELF